MITVWVVELLPGVRKVLPYSSKPKVAAVEEIDMGEVTNAGEAAAGGVQISYVEEGNDDVQFVYAYPKVGSYPAGEARFVSQAPVEPLLPAIFKVISVVV